MVVLEVWTLTLGLVRLLLRLIGGGVTYVNPAVMLQGLSYYCFNLIRIIDWWNSSLTDALVLFQFLFISHLMGGH